MKALGACLGLMVVLAWGCAGQMAVKNALETVEPAPQQNPEPVFFMSSTGYLAVNGPTVVGSRGGALNIAASVHRIFHALGIPTEVSCDEVGQTEGGGQIQSQVQILFPKGLSPAQQAEVKQVLDLIRPHQTAAQEKAPINLAASQALRRKL